MKRFAFTMAEILVSLTIIGIIAAIILPALTDNINERTWNTKRKVLYTRMAQAIALMPNLNSYGTLTPESSSGAGDGVDTATETFLIEGLSKVLKINNICDNAHLEGCGIPKNYIDTQGSEKTIPTTLYELHSFFKSVNYAGAGYSTNDTKAAAFETQNGESIVAYYNRNCRTKSERRRQGEDYYIYPQENMCVNFIYDLNGDKGPNTVGDDMGFITVFNATDPTLVAPLPSNSTHIAAIAWTEASNTCTTNNKESRMPNLDELAALFINKDFINLSTHGYTWSGTAFNSNKAWYLCMRNLYGASGGSINTTAKNASYGVYCIKR